MDQRESEIWHEEADMKESYWKAACNNLEMAVRDAAQKNADLFTMAAGGKAA